MMYNITEYYIRNAFLIFTLVSNVILMISFHFPFWLIKSHLHRKTYVSCIIFIKKAFAEMLIFIMSFFAPYTLHLYGDKIPYNPESAIIISNHQSYLDWIYIWQFAYINNAHGLLKIMINENFNSNFILRCIGYMLEFIFLNNQWNDDQHTICTNLVKTRVYNEKIWLLMFPEKNIIDKTKSEYDLCNSQYVLLPKHRELELCMKYLNDVKVVYDITIGYGGTNKHTTVNNIYSFTNVFFRERGPKYLHVHVNRIYIDDLLHKSKNFEEYLYDIYTKKDKMMHGFYKYGNFGVPTHTLKIESIMRMSPLLLLWIVFILFRILIL